MASYIAPYTVYSKHLAATKKVAKLGQYTAISKSTKLHWEKLSLVPDSSLNATQKNSPRVAATLKNHKHQTNEQTNKRTNEQTNKQTNKQTRNKTLDDWPDFFWDGGW